VGVWSKGKVWKKKRARIVKKGKMDRERFIGDIMM